MKEKKILIRFGELSLKGKNKMNFINILSENIKKICQIEKKEIEIKIDRIFISYSEYAFEKLKYVFGISSFSIVDVVESKIELIEKKIIGYLNFEETKTFKINSRRNEKSFPMNSQEINNYLGGVVLENSNLKVDVVKPNIIFNIEIHKEFTYIFWEKIKGLGGLPVGTSGRVLHLISGGIDSPVAAFLLMKRGIKVDYLSFLTPPHTDEKTIEKVRRIVELLNQYQGKSLIYSFNYSKIMNYISLINDESYRINLMRRSFYRIASQIAKKNNYLAIGNGENIGQVASQTLESILTIQNEAIFPVFRPLLTNDKEETIKLGKEIGTYDISIEKGIEACEFFAPKKPVTKPSIKKALEIEEKELFDIKKLEEEMINKNIEIKVIK